MAKRLVRRICAKCRTAFTPEHTSLPEDLTLPPGGQLHHGTGCEACRQTGYRGRTGLYELLVVNDDIADRILHRRPPAKLIQAGRPGGLRLLREDGWDKVRLGFTTVEEVVTCTAV